MKRSGEPIAVPKCAASGAAALAALGDGQGLLGGQQHGLGIGRCIVERLVPPGPVPEANSGTPRARHAASRRAGRRVPVRRSSRSAVATCGRRAAPGHLRGCSSRPTVRRRCAPRTGSASASRTSCATRAPTGACHPTSSTPASRTSGRGRTVEDMRGLVWDLPGGERVLPRLERPPAPGRPSPSRLDTPPPPRRRATLLVAAAVMVAVLVPARLRRLRSHRDHRRADDERGAARRSCSRRSPSPGLVVARIAQWMLRGRLPAGPWAPYGGRRPVSGGSTRLPSASRSSASTCSARCPPTSATSARRPRAGLPGAWPTTASRCACGAAARRHADRQVRRPACARRGGDRHRRAPVRSLWELTRGPAVAKTRYLVDLGDGLTAEVDVYARRPRGPARPPRWSSTPRSAASPSCRPTGWASRSPATSATPTARSPSTAPRDRRSGRPVGLRDSAGGERRRLHERQPGRRGEQAPSTTGWTLRPYSSTRPSRASDPARRAPPWASR